ncbi:MAG: hypothetical protein WBH08_06735, partial [Methanothrix sp.]|uniref:hypothetical protein n=1 Tax=Methanothrix sp. TaxID=90426 RepID=UPI003BB55F8A
REYGLCSSVSLWLGQSIAFHHIGEKIQRISDSSSPITNSEEPDLMVLIAKAICRSTSYSGNCIIYH